MNQDPGYFCDKGKRITELMESHNRIAKINVNMAKLETNIEYIKKCVEKMMIKDEKIDTDLAAKVGRGELWKIIGVFVTITMITFGVLRSEILSIKNYLSNYDIEIYD